MQLEKTDNACSEFSDDDIVAYLARNPEFFLTHQDILPRLRIPHNCGKAISLIEKQVSVLRGRCAHLENSLHDLIAVARQNECLHQNLHELIKEIITAPSLEHIVALTQSSLRENFNAEEVHMMLIAEAPKLNTSKKSTKNSSKTSKPVRSRHPAPTQIKGARVVRYSDRRIKCFADVFAARQTVCGMPAVDQLNAMIGKDHSQVASAALIPLHHERKLGMLMLVSRDESRFGMNKGVMFLNQMAELLSRRIHSYGPLKGGAAK